MRAIFVLSVVGVGLKREHINLEAKKKIENAEYIFGSRRAIDIAKDFISCEFEVIKSFSGDVYRDIERQAEKDEVVVLSTGDPMIAGLGRFFRDAEIIPGISSVQVALAKLKIDLCDVIVVNAHSREIDGDFKKRGLLILSKKGVNLNFPNVREAVVLEDLCMSDEKIYEIRTESFETKSDYTILFLR